jgi:hypothetical protein
MFPLELTASERMPSGGPIRLPIHNCRTSKPVIPARDAVEGLNRFQHTASVAQSKHARIIRPNVDPVSNSHTARKFELTGSNGRPLAGWRAPAQRIATDNREHTAAPIGGKPPDTQVCDFFPVPIPGDCE